jgi:hypothetical protein
MDFARLFFGERSLTKIAVVFDSRAGAQSAAAAVAAAGDLDTPQVRIVEPFDRAVGAKVEPEDNGIWRTIVRAHVACGALGALAGVVFYAVLRADGIAAAAAAPGLGLLASAGFGALLGLMAGGALSLRPDHEWVLGPVREAARAGRWAVIVHPVSAEQRERVLRAWRAEPRVLSTL